MPVTLARSGACDTIKKITGKDEIRGHLASLGFVVGETITVVSKIGGNVIVIIKDSRVALDKSLADRIMI